MIKKTAIVATAALFAGLSAPALAQSYGPLHPGEALSVSSAKRAASVNKRAPSVNRGRAIHRRAYDAFARFPDSRSFATPYATGRTGVIGKDHGLNGW